MVFEICLNDHILRFIIYEFLKKVSGGSRPTCLAKILCALLQARNNLIFYFWSEICSVLFWEFYGPEGKSIRPGIGLDRPVQKVPGYPGLLNEIHRSLS